MTPIFPDPRILSKLFPPNGPFSPHRCAICNGRFDVGQQFYNYGQGEIVHAACKFSKEKTMNEKLDHCPNCQAENYSWYQVKPGHGDPSQTYCVCNQCGNEFDGVTEND